MQRRDFLGTALATSTLITLPHAAAFANLTRQTGPSFRELALLGSPPAKGLSHNPKRFMSFTVLPNRLTFKVRTDQSHRLHLLQAPRTALHRYWGDIVDGMDITIHEDTDFLKHFTIPWVADPVLQSKRRSISTLIAVETGDDRSLVDFLPPDILAKAILDKNYANDFSEDPKRILADEGYTRPSFEIRILQNGPSTYHIPLRKNTPSFWEIEKMEDRIYKVAQSTKCCASGTCDIDTCF